MPHPQGEETSPGTYQSGEAVRLGEGGAGIPDKSEGGRNSSYNTGISGSGRLAPRGGQREWQVPSPGLGQAQDQAPFCPPPRGAAPACIPHRASAVSRLLPRRPGSLLEASREDPTERGHGYTPQASLPSTRRHACSRHGLDPGADWEDGRAWTSAFLDMARGPRLGRGGRDGGAPGDSPLCADGSWLEGGQGLHELSCSPRDLSQAFSPQSPADRAKEDPQTHLSGRRKRIACSFTQPAINPLSK